MKIHLLFDINGGQVVPQLSLFYDIDTYTNACTSLNFDASSLDFAFYLQIDFLDCGFGTLSALNELYNKLNDQWTGTWDFTSFSKVAECQWKSYKIDYPFFYHGIKGLQYSKELLPQVCIFDQ
jgi:hypothetical protein